MENGPFRRPPGEPSPPLDSEKPDKATVERIRTIVRLFSQTVSALKIYPSHHTAVRSFREDLFKRILDYLDGQDELEIEVEEDAFSFKGERVYQEEKVPRSLPFLFFKDGMQKLIFLRGVGEEDLTEFLEIVRVSALTPTAQSDIVDALWERDFEFIRYSAPDDFLETRIASKEDVFQDLRVDKKSFKRGKIELTREDQEEIRGRMYALGIKEGQENPELDSLVTALEGREDKDVESLLAAERTHSAEAEFLDLLFELLFLEDRIEHFAKILTFVEKHHLALVRGRDFTHAVKLLDHLGDLRDVLAGASPDRAKSLDDFVLISTQAVPLDALENDLKILRREDLPAFFEYLKRLGPRTLRLGIEIFKADPDPDARALAFDFLQELGREDMALLTSLAIERNPDLTKAIISILGGSEDKKAVPLLAAFLSYRSPDIKIEAIRALSNFADELASKIKVEFFQDPDERVRTAAAASLEPRTDHRALDALLAAAADLKSLRKRSKAEKEAILNGLGASRSSEAVEKLNMIVMKRSLFARPRVDETRLAAVAALRGMGTASAAEALEQGSRSRGRRVREACRESLADVAFTEADP